MAESVDTKVCSSCKEELSIDSFGVSSGYKGGRRGQCNPCRSKKGLQRYRASPEARLAQKKARERNADRYREKDVWRHRERKYGLSKERFFEMLRIQGGACAICGTHDPKGAFGVFCVDHCHETGVVRGLLCQSCNVAIGALGDTADSVQRAVDYLRPFS